MNVYLIYSFQGEEGCPSFVTSWIGDGFCDDQANNIECNFDGDDCCGDNVQTDYCSVCQCLSDSGGGLGGTLPPFYSPTTTGNFSYKFSL